MQVDVNSVVLATRIYAALHERFFIGNASGESAEADGGEVLGAIRGAIVYYVEQQLDSASI
ncbi:MAG TPA: hypothetical protein VMU28_15155 [Terriglobales bacterium]|nr:hypothetical protein [Terriglobales bacterium]